MIFPSQVFDGVRIDTASVIVNVIDIADNRPVLSPTESLIILNQDESETDAYLSAGTEGPHRVVDDSAVLVGGTATITVLRNVLSVVTVG